MSAIDMQLWMAVQKITYPKRSPSDFGPFPIDDRLGPKRKPASWLYYLLESDPELRAKVLP